MERSKIKKKYLSKIKELKKHNKLYYEKNNPAINDADYDSLKQEIIDLEKKYLFLKDKNSPNQIVGYSPSKAYEKYTHKIPMLSLSNAFYKEDLENFEKKNI